MEPEEIERNIHKVYLEAMNELYVQLSNYKITTTEFMRRCKVLEEQRDERLKELEQIQYQ